MSETQFLECADGERIAYIARDGASPGVVWFGGFNSAMNGNKARALDAWAVRNRRAYVRFDYFGHGESSGEFRKGTVSRWYADALLVLERLARGPQILVGSSMGGWIALLVALQKPERIAGLVLIAPAVDFTEVLLWASLSESAKSEIAERGEWLRPSAYGPQPYPITRALIEDGRRHLLLGRRNLRLAVPVRILQGMRDPDVPWRHALAVAEALVGDVRLTLIKNGDHRLSTPRDLRFIGDTLAELITDVEKR